MPLQLTRWHSEAVSGLLPIGGWDSDAKLNTKKPQMDQFSISSWIKVTLALTNCRGRIRKDRERKECIILFQIICIKYLNKHVFFMHVKIFVVPF